jgi:4-hydroxy-3-methylbut-2-enyl diphosphate reductase
MNIILVEPRGFCAGVTRAIDIVEKALSIYGAPIYVRHEIVHNKHVVQDLKSKGAIFVSDISEIPENSVVIFSAHGVSDKVELSAQERGLEIIDATCPLVTKVHREAQNLEAMGKQIIMIGHKGHPEVIGTSGRVKQDVTLVSSLEDVEKINPESPDNLSYITQTTLSVDETRIIINALKEKFPNIKGPNLKDICYATQNRQNAVKMMLPHIDLLLVIGSSNSSNSNRLKDLGVEYGINSYLINDHSEINEDWINQASKSIGITAGASAPEILVSEVVNKIQSIRNIEVKTIKVSEENMKFKLPNKLLSTA